VPHLPSEQQQDVWIEALQVARTIEDERTRATALSVLIPYLPLELLDKTLAAARAIADGRDRVMALAALVLRLPSVKQTAVRYEALTTARAITDSMDRFVALEAITPQLLPTDQDIVWAETLLAACTIGMGGSAVRTEALESIAPHLHTVPQHQQLWWETLPMLAVHGRPALLDDLAALTPWLEALATPDDLAAIAQSIIDVSRCWP
jgi:hypothetical protein